MKFLILFEIEILDIVLKIFFLIKIIVDVEKTARGSRNGLFQLQES